MKLASKQIGFIGGGAMAEALAGGLIAAGVPAANLLVSEPVAARRDHLHERLGVAVVDDNAALVDRDVVVLAVKPNVVASALASLSGAAGDLAGPLWISIAAGVRLSALESGLAPNSRIVRAMPNTPALVQTGATALCGNSAASDEDVAFATALFESVGIAWQADTEDQLDAVTGLSGSGPAYAFLFLEALIDAGEAVGLPREAATRLVFQTVAGAVRLAEQSDRSPAELREQVSSPGGTTQVGLEALAAGSFRETIQRAVEAATQRSEELGDASAGSES